MAKKFQFLFEEVEVTIDGVTYLATGTVPVEYIVCAAEPDIGIFNRYAEAEFVGAMDVELVDDNGDATKATIQPRTEAYDQIIDGIDEYYLNDTCLDDYFDR